MEKGHKFMIDQGIIIIIAISMFIGIIKGLIKEIMSLITLSIAFTVAILYHKNIANLFGNTIPNDTKTIISFLLIVFAILIIGGIISKALANIIGFVQLNMTNRITGAIFGLIRAILIIALIIVALRLFKLNPDNYFKDSKLITKFIPIAMLIENKLPDNLKNLNLPNESQTTSNTNDNKEPSKEELGVKLLELLNNKNNSEKPIDKK